MLKGLFLFNIGLVIFVITNGGVSLIGFLLCNAIAIPVLYLYFFISYNPLRTAKKMVRAFKSGISGGGHPKIGLIFAVEEIKEQSFELRTMSMNSEQLLTFIFKEKYENLSENYDEAKDFVVHVLMTLISGYTHPKLFPIHEDIRDFQKNELKRQKLELSIRSLL